MKPFKDKNICIDYLSFTFKYTADEAIYKNSARDELTFLNLRELLDILNIEDVGLTWESGGFYGYRKKIEFFDKAIIFQKDLASLIHDQDKSLLVEIKGSGCRLLDNNNVSYKELSSFIKRNGCTVTRFDLALDDYSGKFSVPFLYEETKKQNYTSPLKYISFRNDKAENIDSGLSLTFGKTTSERQLQIYDKFLERESKDAIDFDEIKSNYWLRFEMRFRGRYASLFHEFAMIETKEELAKFYFTNLITLLDFKEENNFSRENLYKAKSASWWEEFTEDYDHVENINRHKITSQAIDSINWCLSSAMNSLIKTRFVLGKDLFNKIIEEKTQEFISSGKSLSEIVQLRDQVKYFFENKKIPPDLKINENNFNKLVENPLIKQNKDLLDFDFIENLFEHKKTFENFKDDLKKFFEKDKNEK